MNELQINVELNSGSIITNTEELKERLAIKMSEYENAVFTEESKQIAKAELAGLRKLKEAVEKRRKEIKAQCMAPYNDFEKEVVYYLNYSPEVQSVKYTGNDGTELLTEEKISTGEVLEIQPWNLKIIER